MSKYEYYEWHCDPSTRKKNPWLLVNFEMDGLLNWELREGNKIDNWNIQNFAEFKNDGIKEDFALSISYLPIISERMKTVIEKLAPGEIQYLPLKIYKQDTREEVGGYYIANVLNIIDCIDREHSSYSEWLPEDNQPDRLGDFKYVKEAVINTALIGDTMIFRPKCWTLMLIIREDVMKAFKKAGFSAGRFSKLKTTDSKLRKKENCKQHENIDLEGIESRLLRAIEGKTGTDYMEILNSELKSIQTDRLSDYERKLIHIAKYIGVPTVTIHEIASDIVHIDIYCIPPREGRNYYTLITSGMSDKSMITPKKEREFRYSELLIYLPSTWPLSEKDCEREENYWPVRWLTILARMPHEYKSWFGPGHTVSNDEPPEPFAENIRMCGIALSRPLHEHNGFWMFNVSRRKTINYLQIIPLYREEMNFVIENSLEELLERFKEKCISPVLDANRKNMCER